MDVFKERENSFSSSIKPFRKVPLPNKQQGGGQCFVYKPPGNRGNNFYRNGHKKWNGNGRRNDNYSSSSYGKYLYYPNYYINYCSNLFPKLVLLKEQENVHQVVKNLFLK